MMDVGGGGAADRLHVTVIGPSRVILQRQEDEEYPSARMTTWRWRGMLRLGHPSPSSEAASVLAYKLRTTHAKLFTVQRAEGLLGPGDMVDVVITTRLACGSEAELAAIQATRFQVLSFHLSGDDFDPSVVPTHAGAIDWTSPMVVRQILPVDFCHADTSGHESRRGAPAKGVAPATARLGQIEVDVAAGQCDRGRVDGKATCSSSCGQLVEIGSGDLSKTGQSMVSRRCSGITSTSSGGSSSSSGCSVHEDRVTTIARRRALMPTGPLLELVIKKVTPRMHLNHEEVMDLKELKSNLGPAEWTAWLNHARAVWKQRRAEAAAATAERSTAHNARCYTPAEPQQAFLVATRRLSTHDAGRTDSEDKDDSVSTPSATPLLGAAASARKGHHLTPSLAQDSEVIRSALVVLRSLEDLETSTSPTYAPPAPEMAQGHSPSSVPSPTHAEPGAILVQPGVAARSRPSHDHSKSTGNVCGSFKHSARTTAAGDLQVRPRRPLAEPKPIAMQSTDTEAFVQDEQTSAGTKSGDTGKGAGTCEGCGQEGADNAGLADVRIAEAALRRFAEGLRAHGRQGEDLSRVSQALKLLEGVGDGAASSQSAETHFELNRNSQALHGKVKILSTLAAGLRAAQSELREDVANGLAGVQRDVLAFCSVLQRCCGRLREGRAGAAVAPFLTLAVVEGARSLRGRVDITLNDDTVKISHRSKCHEFRLDRVKIGATTETERRPSADCVFGELSGLTLETIKDGGVFSVFVRGSSVAGTGASIEGDAGGSGLLSLTVAHILRDSSMTNSSVDLSVTALEVSGEAVRDLLGRREEPAATAFYTLKADETGHGYFTNALAVRVRSVADMERLCGVLVARIPSATSTSSSLPCTSAPASPDDCDNPSHSITCTCRRITCTTVIMLSICLRAPDTPPVCSRIYFIGMSPALTTEPSQHRGAAAHMVPPCSVPRSSRATVANCCGRNTRPSADEEAVEAMLEPRKVGHHGQWWRHDGTEHPRGLHAELLAEAFAPYAAVGVIACISDDPEHVDDSLAALTLAARRITVVSASSHVDINGWLYDDERCFADARLRS